MKKKTIIFSIIIASILILGCTKEEIKENNQIANPASEFCIKNSGTLDIITAEDGSQKGLCILSSGYVCDEWKYFRGECPCGDEKTYNCPQYSPPSPQFCKDGIVLPGEYDDCGCAGPPRCKAIDNYTIAEWMNNSCEGPFDCQTPMNYLVRSNCPYTSMCINNTCAVVCPAPYNTPV